NVTATDNWWGAVDGPGGSGTGSGDEISDNVVISGQSGDDIRTDGSEFSYFNAGGSANSAGTLSSPTVIQGTASTEFGTSDAQSVLYDFDRVILNYSAIATDQNYDLYVTYYNPDSTSSAGTRQHLSDITETSIHDEQTLPTTAPSIYHYPLAASSYSSGQLDLNFDLDDGFRASVAQLWLVERVNVDTT
ncbi:MAG: hypothetical protein GY820_36345, partial [Gammaproteobacteria bacterium]|nr:hypothetical protein [Gammaproteobacteria bacterium]